MERLKQAPGIIPALDTSLGKGLILAGKLNGLANKITGLKYGSYIMDDRGYRASLPLFEEVAPDLSIIVDRQKGATDAPPFVKEQVLMAKKYSNVVAMIGSPLGAGSYRDLDNPEKKGTLEAFVDTCHASPEIVPIIVIEMTQPGALAFSEEKYCEKLLKTCVEYNVEYIVAPATKPERIEVYKRIADELSKGGIEIISPGVGPQKTGDPLKDVEAAVLVGADHIVSGRAVLKASDPVKAVNDLYEVAVKAHELRMRGS